MIVVVVAVVVVVVLVEWKEREREIWYGGERGLGLGRPKGVEVV